MEQPKNKNLPYKVFQQRNPEYRSDYWQRCRAFYSGGPDLLESCVIDKVFPRQKSETWETYEKRKQMAHYTNYAGEIVNHMLALLGTSPIRVDSDDMSDPFYQEFLENVAPPGTTKKSLHVLLRDMFLTAVTCKRAWALVELPKTDTYYATLAEQDASGGRSAWAIEIAPECVIDWAKGPSGDLDWALVMYRDCERKSLLDTREMVREEYWLYTKTGWAKWEVKYKKGEEPDPDAPVAFIDSGTHTFGCVPLVPLELPDGLWVMSKLESLAREHFTKRNALSWAEYKTLLPVLYEFLDPGPFPTLPGPGGEEDRAVAQPRSVSSVQERQAARDKGDKVEWVAPSHLPFNHALESCNNLRDEMHRVVHQIALSADTKGKALIRSGDSKKVDAAALCIVLEAFGELGRRFGEGLMETISRGRGDDMNWTASGMDDFDAASAAEILEEESLLDTAVQIPSATFKVLRKFNAAKKLLGDWANEEDLRQIEGEIKGFYSNEAELIEQEIDKKIESEPPDEDEPGMVSEDVSTEEADNPGTERNAGRRRVYGNL